MQLLLPRKGKYREGVCKLRILNKHFLHIFIVFFTIGSFYYSASAKHIIGGEVTYVCTGTGSYDFKIIMYRDCSAADGAPFDGYGGLAASVTVYKGDSHVPLMTLNPGSPVVTTISPNLSNPCLIVPPNVCVEEGIYSFHLDLPVSDESYHIVYQRCCRNVTITNIANPGGSGATYYTELTAEAQSLCNNSPTFDDFPPIVICAGEDINFSHAATDVDGDQLIYSFFTPFLGGGLDEYNYTSPSGVAPDPDSPPPYSSVSFISPPYSYLNPLGGTGIMIDANTGLISGTPDILGQFVVGVLVKEYRNGILIGELRRDFQFNVANCEPTVVADIQEDSIIILDNETFVVSSCGALGVDIVNESYQSQYIDNYFWQFDISGSLQTFSTWSPHINFPEIGVYSGMLVLNPGTTCGDTAFVQVNIFPDVYPDFSYSYDTCIAGPVIFTNSSYSGAGSGMITSSRWDFGDSEFSEIWEPEHTYQIPGELPVNLMVKDTNGCENAIEKIVSYFPAPALIIISPSAHLSCQPATIFFDNLSVPIDDTYDILWDFGDGTSGSEISPYHTYEESGIYTVTIEITSPIGCFTDTIFPDLITVEPAPVAGFSYSPTSPSNFEPTVNFMDESEGAISWWWDFSGLSTSIERNPGFTFPDTGLFVVEQIVRHVSGCLDTARAIIDIEPQIRYFLPNAFTPNGDGDNDIFKGRGIMKGAENFHLTIWSRWGELIFESTDPNTGWNGQKNNTGQMSPAGVYICLVNFDAPRGKKVEINGFAILVK